MAQVFQAVALPSACAGLRDSCWEQAEGDLRRSSTGWSSGQSSWYLVIWHQYQRVLPVIDCFIQWRSSEPYTKQPSPVSSGNILTLILMEGMPSKEENSGSTRPQPQGTYLARTGLEGVSRPVWWRSFSQRYKRRTERNEGEGGA